MGKQVTTGTPTHFQGSQFFESNGKQTTNDHTDPQVFEAAFTRTTKPLVAAFYKLSWSCEGKLNPTGPINSIIAARFLVGGNVKGSDQTRHGSTVLADGWVELGSWDRYAATEGEIIELKIEWRRDAGEGGNDAAEIRKLKLGVELFEED